MDLAGQPATRATNMLAVVIGDAGTMLVHADNGRICTVPSCATANASMIRSQMPARRQRTNRL
jgi:hypothetical protein